MPTVIDALVVELGLDVGGLAPGRKVVEDTFKKTQEGAEKTGKTIDDVARRSEIYLTKLRNNVIALYAAFTGGKALREFVGDMTTSDAALGRFASILGQSAGMIANWRNAAKLMGLSADDIDGTFQTLTNDFNQFALTGQSQIIPWFRMLGVQITDLHGHMLPLDQLFLNLHNRLKGFDRPRAAAILQNMGFTPGAIQLILSSDEALKKALADSKKLSDEQVKDVAAAQARQRAWNQLKQTWESVGLTILTALTPALLQLGQILQSVAAWFQAHPNIAGATFGALTAVVIALTAAMGLLAASSAWATIAGGMGVIVTLSKGIALGIAVLTETLFPALSEAFFGLALAIEATPIGWIITGIAALGGAAYYLYEHWKGVKDWWHGLFGGMGDDAEKAAGRVSGAAGRARGGAGAGSGVGGSTALEKTENLLKGFEGFTGKAKWDVNAYRAGYGSDTITDPVTGQVTSVNAGTTVTREQAQADLARRTGVVLTQAQAAIGAAWNRLSNDTQAAIASVTYNYGHVPQGVAAAAKTGDAARVAAAIKSLKGDNSGVNASRRATEADVALAGASDTGRAFAAATTPAQAPNVANGAQGSALASNAYDNRRSNTSTSTSETHIREINVYGSDPNNGKQVAVDLSDALQRDSFAQQANYGPA